MSYNDDIKIIREQLFYDDKLETMADACHGILDAIKGMQTEPKQYRMHLTDLWDNLGLLRVAVKALEWYKNGEEHEAVYAIADADLFYTQTIAYNVSRRAEEKEDSDAAD